ncbi:hypothetical protein F5X98DRAFT_352468 [Xylaria grammica]|nr:hypothetical protein F5X98DRAFT_352468 [Xylaria grammica]
MDPCRPLAAKPNLLIASSLRPSMQLNNRIVKQRRSRLAATDWEEKKQVIVELYIQKCRQAEDVVEILKSEFKFNTSRRQLFNKLNEWGVKKNKRRNTEYVPDIPEESGDENSAVEPDNMVHGIATPSSELVIRSQSASHPPCDSEMFGEMNTQCQPASWRPSASPPPPQQPHCPCVDTNSPTTQYLQYSEIPLEKLGLKTPRPLSDGDANPPWALARAFSPQSTDLSRPSTPIATRTRTPSSTAFGLHYQPWSENLDVSPASPQAVRERITWMEGRWSRQTFEINQSLVNRLLSVAYRNNAQMEADVSLVADFARSGLFRTRCAQHDLSNVSRLVNGVIPSASRIAISMEGPCRANYLLPEANLKGWQRETTVYFGTSILTITTKEEYPKFICCCIKDIKDSKHMIVLQVPAKPESRMVA